MKQLSRAACPLDSAFGRGTPRNGGQRRIRETLPVKEAFKKNTFLSSFDDKMGVMCNLTYCMLTLNRFTTTSIPL